MYADFVPRQGYKLSEAELKTHKIREGNKVWKNPRISLEERPIPQITKPDEVLIRVKAVGICGSDLHFVETDEDGYMIYPGLVRTPVVIGHEFSGIVEEVGSGVK
ncbi:MAG: alcohol dehydrogenase, partial [Thaumarchaeota archaeon]